MDFKKFRYEVLIREHHIDTYGHVNNARYLEILEEARWEFFYANHYGMAFIQKSGLGPIILEINIRYLKELRVRERIVVESQTLSYEKKIGRLRQDIFNSKNELASTAELTFALFDMQQRKLVLPSPEWLKAVGVSV